MRVGLLRQSTIKGLMMSTEYFAAIDEQIDALLHATGLMWELENTGGGHDALVSYLVDEDGDGVRLVRRDFLMLTCDASVVRIGRDRYAMLGLYLDEANSCEAERMAFLNDESHPPLTLGQLVDFVAETLQGWGVK